MAMNIPMPTPGALTFDPVGAYAKGAQQKQQRLKQALIMKLAEEKGQRAQQLFPGQFQEQQMGIEKAQQQQQLQQAFQQALMGGQMPPQQQAPQQQMAPQEAMMQQQQAPGQQPGTMGEPGVMGAPGLDQSNDGFNEVVKGNPAMSQIDKLVSNPRFKEIAKQQGFEIKETDKLNPKTGEHSFIRKYPSGRIEEKVVKVGTSPGDIAQETKAGQFKAERIHEMEGTYESQVDLVDTLGATLTALQGAKDARGIVGPVNKSMTEFLSGDPESKDLVGTLEALSGKVFMNVMKEFKGSFREFEKKIIDKMKFNPNDMYDVGMGKLSVQMAAAEVGRDRTDMALELMEEQHMPYRKAWKQAQEAFPLQEAIDRAKESISQIGAQQGGAPQGRAQQSGKVNIIAPDGKSYMIPESQVEQALAKGGKHAGV